MVLLVNLAGLFCIVASLFLLPSNTRVWSWAVVSGLLMVAMNAVVFLRLRKADLASTPVSSPTKSAYAMWLWLTAIVAYQFFEGGFSRVLALTEIGIFFVCGGLIWLAKKIAEGYRK